MHRNSLIFWKFASIVLFCALLISNVPWKSGTSVEKLVIPATLQDTTTDTTSPQPTGLPYPANFFRLQKGIATTTSTPSNNSLINGFTITLTPHNQDTQNTHTFTIALSDRDYMDYVDNPKISHQQNYACVTVGASGYSGYYIFSLPDGRKISQGKQYSECVEWLDDTKVLIVEEPYGTQNVIYSIFDVLNETKIVVSKFSNN